MMPPRSEPDRLEVPNRLEDLSIEGLAKRVDNIEKVLAEIGDSIARMSNPLTLGGRSHWLQLAA